LNSHRGHNAEADIDTRGTAADAELFLPVFKLEEKKKCCLVLGLIYLCQSFPLILSRLWKLSPLLPDDF
jgi:hypothetical protein